jgi:pimeloyl-ACP methyl ester carboxylesterase
VVDTPLTVGHGGRKVVCLHGWFGSARGWGGWPDLPDTDTFTYAFLDYRGYGARRDETGDHTLEEIAADTLATADALGWPTFSLVGHSMGGTAMQRVYTRAPDRVEAMVGISPVPATGVPFDEDGWALFSGAAQDDDKRAAIIDLTTGNRLSSVWLRQMVAHSVEHSTREAVAGYLLAWAQTDFSAEIAGSKVPVKVIVGEHDPALGASVMEQTFLDFYPGADLEVLANAGHYAMFETPVALATTVEEFLRR